MDTETLKQQIIDAIANGKIQATTINIGDQIQNQQNYNIEGAGDIRIQIVSPDAPAVAEFVAEHGATPQPKPEVPIFCCITDEAIRTGKAQKVEDELRHTCSSAAKLIKTIRTNEALGYLATKDISSINLYKLLDEHFGLPFKPHAFAVQRSKKA